MANMTQSFRRLDRSVRWSFRFEGAEITLFDRREVEMTALPSQERRRRNPEERSGCWVELQDRDGRVLYRRGMQHPLVRRSELVAEHGSFSNHLWVAQRGAFSVVVPNLAEAAELVIFASPAEQPEVPKPAAELLRVPVRQGGPPGHPQPDRPDEG